MILQALDGNGPTFQWEKGGQFYPENVQRRALPTRFVDINGGTIEGKPVYSYFDVDRESVGNILGERMSFLDPSYFIAGNVHNNIDLWRKIIPDPHCEAMDWIENKVDINKFIAHFKGEFNGVSYDHSYPPARIFRNSSNYKQFVEFINLELTERLQTGAISYIGKVGEVQPPHVVSPITIEASKPRLCINLMYVNCFMRETPFTLDSLTDVPRVIRQGEYLTKLDDLSGYNNVLMSENSRSLLGFQWAGHYFVCNSIPMGWRNSAFVYNSINLHVMSYLRKQSVTSLLCIDDRMMGEYVGEVPQHLDDPVSRSQIAIHWVVMLRLFRIFFKYVKVCAFSHTGTNILRNDC